MYDMYVPTLVPQHARGSVLDVHGWVDFDPKQSFEYRSGHHWCQCSRAGRLVSTSSGVLGEIECLGLGGTGRVRVRPLKAARGTTCLGQMGALSSASRHTTTLVVTMD